MRARSTDEPAMPMAARIAFEPTSSVPSRTPLIAVGGSATATPPAGAAVSIERGERWMIVTIAYTVEQPPACERHPDGPPGSDS
jgi:hypothetical protein